jgi:hypothetical protein
VIAATIMNDPFALRDLLVASCAGGAAALNAATASAARALSLGASMGERITGLADCVMRQTKVRGPLQVALILTRPHRQCAPAANPIATYHIAHSLAMRARRFPLDHPSSSAQLLAHRVTRGGSAECAALGQLAPGVAERVVTWLAGRAVGCWMALRLQSLSMQLHVALLSAQALVTGIGALPRPGGGGADDEDGEVGASQDGASAAGSDAQSRALVPRNSLRRHEIAVWAIAIVGMQMGASAAPPLPIRLLLLPVYGMEALLRTAAAHSTRGELAAALRKRQLGQ